MIENNRSDGTVSICVNVYDTFFKFIDKYFILRHRIDIEVFTKNWEKYTKSIHFSQFFTKASLYNIVEEN